VTERTSITDQAQAFPAFNPFNSNDPEIRFMIATVVTAAVLLTDIDCEEQPTEWDHYFDMLVIAANELKRATIERVRKEIEDG